MSETPRNQRELWHEVSRTFEEFGEALRLHLSPDAARSPSDPTAPRSSAHRPGAHSDGPVDPADTEPAPWADPARPAESDGSTIPWAAATDAPPRAVHPRRPYCGRHRWNTGSNGAGGGGRTTAAQPTSGTDATAAGRRAPGRPEPAGAVPRAKPARPAPAGPGPPPAGQGTERDRPRPTGQAGPRPGAPAAQPAGPARPGAGTAQRRTRGWRGSGAGGGGSGAGPTGGGRFAGPADWDSARESVRDLGGSVRRIATQAGDAARDPQVRDSAQRAARSLGDAIVTTVEDLAAELRERMRNHPLVGPVRPARAPAGRPHRGPPRRQAVTRQVPA